MELYLHNLAVQIISNYLKVMLNTPNEGVNFYREVTFLIFAEDDIILGFIKKKAYFPIETSFNYDKSTSKVTH